HSFPLDEVPRYVSSRGVRDTLEHAILDSPMFQARWRWNLNRSLMVLRFRGGKRNPPPIQRMESDDLLAAVFPQAAACQENVTGPVEIPDHVLVRQTVDDTLHEALDIDGLLALLAGLAGRNRPRKAWMAWTGVIAGSLLLVFAAIVAVILLNAFLMLG
ncbi:MAG: hypothetical protein ACRDG9_10145, partial [Actinomycetota bacterium]